MKNFESFFANEFKEFIAYRQNLGFATRPLRLKLLIFDRYLKEQKTKPDLLQPLFFLELRANLKMEPASVNRVLYTASAFFQFLVRKGCYVENPVKDIPPLPENAVIPFVFSPKQVDQLLCAVCKKIRKDQRYFLKDLSVYMAIVLLARCGLRISEPLRLLPSHYRSKEKTLYIEKTKFKKDRLIPVPKSVATVSENYLAVRNTLLSEDQNPYLLVSTKKGGLNDSRVRLVFHQAVKDIGLDQPRQIIGDTNFSSPTPHSLRHSCAVNTLMSVKKRGKSLKNALPVLATYMGHIGYKHTIKYLKVVNAKHRQRLFFCATSQKEDI